MSKTKNCKTCYYSDKIHNRFHCMPCIRGKFVADNWKPKEKKIKKLID